MKISNKYQIPARKLEFLNIDLSKDNKIFIDPVKIKRGNSDLHKTCYNKINSFMQNLFELLRNRRYKDLLEIIYNLYERNETRLGYSLESAYGKSLGGNAGRDLVKQLAKNEMVNNGEVEDIFDCLIMVPNIGEDKVSDLITTIIFKDLIEYTQNQCKLWKIDMKKVMIKKLCWDADDKKWIKIREEYPCTKYVVLDFVKKYDNVYR